MAGSTSNTDILKALNQAIQAINDLVLGGDTVVVEAPNVTVRPSVTVNCNCGCGGYGGSSQPVIDSDPVDGYPPPSGSAPVDENKCKRVNFLIDQYLDYLWNTERVFTAVSVGPSAGMAAWIAQVPLVFSSLALAGAVVALFWYVATLLVGGLALGLAVLAHKTALENDKANFVCDLYNAGTPADARAVIQQYMSDNLAGLPESWVSYHVDHIFPNNVLNGLFNAWGDDVEAALAAYAGSVDCGGCGGNDEGFTWDFSINANGGVATNQEALITSMNGIANSYDGGGHWWTNGYGSWTTFKLRPGKSLFIPSGSVVKVWWENADGSAQGVFEQYQVSQNYGYFAGPNYGGSSPSEVVINRDWSTNELFLTPHLGGLRITKIVIVGVF